MTAHAEWKKDMKEEYTLISPQMSPIHFQFFEQVFQDAGFKFRVIEHVTEEAIACGLRCVNNDMCCPSILTAGQVIDETIRLKDENPNQKYAIIMTQTGGGCRASQYVGAIRKAIGESKYPDIPVVPLAFVPGGDEPWNQLGIKIRDVKHAIYGVLLGDILMTMLYKTRPYEINHGESNRLVAKLSEQIRSSGFRKMGYRQFKKLTRTIMDEFGQVSVSKEPKPKIGVVGEILLKYHPDANNHLVEVIEQEGCEAVVSPIIDFFLYCFSGPVFQHKLLARGWWKSAFAKLLIGFVERRKKKVSQICGFHWPSIYELSEKVKAKVGFEEVISLANSMGEGWLLPAEIIDLTELGCPHVVIAQPFACLPNHSIGQGTLAPIEKRYPESCVISINYDPNTSVANQLNRIKLLAHAARTYHAKQRAITQ